MFVEFLLFIGIILKERVCIVWFCCDEGEDILLELIFPNGLCMFRLIYCERGKRKKCKDRWVIYVIFVESRDPWCTAVLMLRAYVCLVIGVCILLMPFPGVIHEPFCARDAIHKLPLWGVLRRKFQCVRIVIGWVTECLHLGHIRDRESVATPAALQPRNCLQYGHLCWISLPSGSVLHASKN